MHSPLDLHAVTESELFYRIASIVELKNPEPRGLTNNLALRVFEQFELRRA
jgi:hypothetical protein